METTKLKSIQMSMMKMSGDINKKSKAHYVKKRTAKFTVPTDFFTTLSEQETEELISGLVNGIYEDLQKEISYNEADSVGIWIDYDGKMYENAMKFNVLNEMKQFGNDDVDPVYELFKMTLNEIYYSPINGDV